MFRFHEGSVSFSCFPSKSFGFPALLQDLEKETLQTQIKLVSKGLIEHFNAPTFGGFRPTTATRSPIEVLPARVHIIVRGEALV